MAGLLTRGSQFARSFPSLTLSGDHRGHSPLTVAGAVTVLARFGSSSPYSLFIPYAFSAQGNHQGYVSGILDSRSRVHGGFCAWPDRQVRVSKADRANEASGCHPLELLRNLLASHRQIESAVPIFDAGPARRSLIQSPPTSLNIRGFRYLCRFARIPRSR